MNAYTSAQIKMKRTKSGSILVLGMATLLLLVLFIVVPYFELSQLFVKTQRQQNAVDAAALAAANQISRIVVNDPYFGYVSLSDYPPVGKATLAPDGEPLPVSSINSIAATCRSELLLAMHLNNDQMLSLALKDIEHYRRASHNLEIVLQEAILPKTKLQFFDLDGNSVQPYQCALEAYASNVDKSHLNGKLELSLGWLKARTKTETLLQRDSHFAKSSLSSDRSAYYTAFKDCPVGPSSFYFSAVNAQAALAPAGAFVESNGKWVSSVVRAAVNLPLISNLHNGGDKPAAVKFTSCAIAPALPPHRVAGAFVLSLPNGPPTGVRSLADLLKAEEYCSAPNVALYRAVRGDFPTDRESQLVPNEEQRFSNARTILAQGLYDWARNCGSQLKLDELERALDFRFDAPSKEGDRGVSAVSLFFEMDKDGNVVITKHVANPFPQDVVCESQLYGVALSSLEYGDALWSLQFRDNVNRSAACGGKHAGEPLCSPVVNWSELQTFNGNPEVSREKGKGGEALGLTVSGKPSPYGDSNAIASDSAYFEKRGGGLLNKQPRKSYYSGGAAVEICISSPTHREIFSELPQARLALQERLKVTPF